MAKTQYQQATQFASKIDLRKDITDRIIQLFGQGNKWKHFLRKHSFAVNAISKKPYRGFNILLLALAGIQGGFKHNAWLTFKQASDLGAKIKKGSKGVRLGYFDMKQKENKETGEIEVFPVMTSFTVFNIDQCEGLKPDFIKQFERSKSDKNAKNKEVESLLKKTKAKISNDGGTRAFYRHNDDSIHLPKIDDCTSTEQYYATALHELVHWTMTPKRCDRKVTGTFGTPSYAFEELVAELGATFLCTELGIDSDIKNHASYIEGWLQALQDDKNYIFKASSLANKAVDFILAFRESKAKAKVKKAA